MTTNDDGTITKDLVVEVNKTITTAACIDVPVDLLEDGEIPTTDPKKMIAFGEFMDKEAMNIAADKQLEAEAEVWVRADWRRI